jgi:hypothetical protein
MTWLSRLLPQTSSLQRHTSAHNRSTKQRRRVMTLESLEHRIVLSDVSATFSSGVLTIVSNVSSNPPIGGNAFDIIEGSSAGDLGKVTVKPATGSIATTVNGVGVPFTTPAAVTQIDVIIVGANKSIAETVNLLGPGKTVPTTVKNVTFTVTTANLTLNANNIDNSGTFTLNTTGGLNAHIDNSQFSALTIKQTGPDACCAIVELGNDTITGAVSVTEADAASSQIIVQNGSSLGSTTLVQGNGNKDSVKVVDSKVRELTITQGNGDDDSILVDNVQITAAGKGVSTSQGNGARDQTTINKVSLAPGITLNVNGPLSTIPSITVLQGNGDRDRASVTNSNVPGNITITQGTGRRDEAVITDDVAGFSFGGLLFFGQVSITQKDVTDGDTARIEHVDANHAFITQGNADDDSATVKDSTIHGSVIVKQGNGNRDNAEVSNVHGVTGGISITQGDGSWDTALIDPVDTAFGDISIKQGNGNDDHATIDDAHSFLGDIWIQQGKGDRDHASITRSSTDKGDIWIKQDNGNDDDASVCDSHTEKGNITITQGNGHRDQASVSDSSTKQGDVKITQGNGNQDYAEIVRTNAGDRVPLGPFYVDIGGTATIKQGDGNGDTAVFDCDNVNNIVAIQGNNVYDPTCDPGLLDTVRVNDSRVTSDITITQGNGRSAGGYYASIGDESSVTAGGRTTITQNGVGNFVNLGYGSSFETNFLDVFTGQGSALVVAANTTVFIGSFNGVSPTITGNGLNNTFVDAGGNYGVTVAGNFNFVFI